MSAQGSICFMLLVLMFLYFRISQHFEVTIEIIPTQITLDLTNISVNEGSRRILSSQLFHTEYTSQLSNSMMYVIVRAPNHVSNEKYSKIMHSLYVVIN